MMQRIRAALALAFTSGPLAALAAPADGAFPRSLRPSLPSPSRPSRGATGSSACSSR
ncbi:hypothetical protein ACU4GR_33115 [Methylobacterium oryzae CBMB20]